jgi:hypothetical protein
MMAAGGICRQRERASLLQVLLKPMLEEGTRGVPPNNQRVHRGTGSWAR